MAASPAALGSSSSGTAVAAGGMLQIAGVSIGAEPLALAGSGNGRSGSLGALTASGSATANGPVTLDGTTSIGVATGATLTLGGGIGESSVATLHKTGSGTLVLDAPAVPSGGTSVDAGTLRIGVTDALPGTVTVTSTGTLALDVNNSAQLLSLAGTLSGSGTFSAPSIALTGATVNANLGSGSLDAVGNNTLNGTAASDVVVLNGGTLTLGAGGRFTGRPLVLVPFGATLATGGAETVSDLSGAGTVALAGRLTLDNASGGSFDGTLTGSGGFTKDGGGSFLLNGQSTYTGSTVVAAGVLQLGTSNALPTGTTLTVANGAEFNLGADFSQTVARFSGGSVGGSGTLTAGAFEMDGGAAGTGVVLAGPSLVVRGGYTVNGMLDIPSVQVVAGGTLTMGAGDRLLDTAAVAVDNGGTLVLQGSDTIAGLALGGTLSAGAPGDTLNALSYALSDGAVVGAALGGGQLVATGNTRLNAPAAIDRLAVPGGTLTLGSSNLLTALPGVTLSGGTLALAGTSQTVGSFTLAGGTLGAGTLTSSSELQLQSGTVNATLAGSAGVRKTGGGTVTLAAGSTYAGSTTVAGGVLRISDAGALGSTAGGTTVSGGTLLLDGVSLSGEALSLAGSGASGAGALAASGSVTVAGAVALAGDARIGVAAAGDTLRLVQSVTDGGAGRALTKSGDGTLQLDGAQGAGTWRGGTTVAGGTLALGASNVLSDLGGVVVDGGTLAIGTRSDRVASLTLRAGTVSGSSGVLASSGTIELQQGSVGALLEGDAGLAKTGAGSVTLSRPIAYPGSTTLDGGTLVLAGSQLLPAGTGVSVDGGATLALGSNTQGVAGFSLLDGTLDGSGTLTSASTFDLRSGQVRARLAGSVGLDKTGAGSVSLGHANGITGAVRVLAGTLAVGDAGALGSTGQGTTVSAGATLQLDGVALGNEALTLAGSGVGGAGALLGTGNASVAGSVTLAADTTIGVDAVSSTPGPGGVVGAVTATLTLASAVTDGGQGHALTKAGAGTLQVAGGTAHGGATTVAAGTLQTLAANRLSDASPVTVAAGATLALGGDDQVPTLVTAGNVLGSGHTLQAASYALQAGALVGVNLGSGALTVSGDSRLDGTAAASTVDLAGGTLTLGAAERLSDSAVVTVAGGATLLLTEAERVGSFTLAGGTLAGPGVLAVDRVRSSGDSTISGASSATRIEVAGGSLTLATDAVLSAQASVTVGSDAALVVQDTQQVASLTLDGGTLAGAGTLAAQTLTSSGRSTMSGRAEVGTLRVADTLTLAAGGRLVGAPTVVVNEDATLALAGSETVGRLTGAGTVTIGAGTLSAGSGGDARFDGVLGGAGGFTKLGAGTTFTLGGRLTAVGPVRVSGGTLATAGADRIADRATLSVDTGARLSLGGSERVAALQLGGTLAGRGTLTAATYALGDGGQVGLALGAGTLTASGRSRIDATVGASRVAVGRAATLTLAAGGRLNGDAEVSVGAGGTLVTAGDERVRELRLDGGTLRGSGLFSAGRTRLDGGTVQVRLGGGELLSTGFSRLAADAASRRVTVSGGRLDVEGRLTAAPDVTVAAGTLRLSRAQTLGALVADGGLEVLAALNAERIVARGDALLGAAVTTRGDQRWSGRLRVADGGPAAELRAGMDARIEADHAGNDFGPGALALRAGSVAVRDGVGGFALGRVELGDGDSTITGQGALALQGRVTLGAGSLALASDATPLAGRAASGSGGQGAYLPDPVNGAQSGRRVVFASEAITQAEGATIETGAGSRLLVHATRGGSITLDAAGNRFGGGVSALSDAGAEPMLAGAPAGEARVSRVELRGDVLRLVAADAGDAVRGDVVVLAGQRISTEDGAVVRARLPYGANQGAASQIAGLTLDITGGSGQFGSLDAPLAVAVGRPQGATGIGGLLVDVLPAPGSGRSAPVGSAVYLACDGCDTRPYYLRGGDPLAVPTYFNGVQLTDAPPGASAITTTTTLLENARRALFEQAVRTENVAPRLRAGVIAEVGKGRPATEGSGSLRKPELCDGAAGALDCGAAP